MARRRAGSHRQGARMEQGEHGEHMYGRTWEDVHANDGGPPLPFVVKTAAGPRDNDAGFNC